MFRGALFLLTLSLLSNIALAENYRLASSEETLESETDVRLGADVIASPVLTEPRAMLGVFLGISSVDRAKGFNLSAPSIGLRGDVRLTSFEGVGNLNLEFGGQYAAQGGRSGTTDYGVMNSTTSMQSSHLLTGEITLKLQRRFKVGHFAIVPKIGVGPDFQSFSGDWSINAVSNGVFGTDYVYDGNYQKTRVLGAHLLVGIDIFVSDSFVLGAETRRNLYAIGDDGDGSANMSDTGGLSASRTRFNARFEIVDNFWLGVELQTHDFYHGANGVRQSLFLGSLQIGL